MKVQLEKLYTLLSTDSTLQALLKGTTTNKKVYPVLSDRFEDFPCITYREAGSTWRSVPRNYQDMSVEFYIYSKTSNAHVEDIHVRINAVVNYFVQANNEIVYARESNAVENNQTDRQLFSKIVRYQIWCRN